jgi:hypothetical protein
MSPSGSHGRERDANRLADSRSPYLLQHRFNPVDWHPWGPEAFEKASREDKPVFLSIGYSSCHWCHVMERESFESEAIAERLNRDFVSIKVDREERPDVDEIYMSAVQLLTGSGGWPLSVFLTPEQKPFWGGTYFPPEDRQGRPGFATIVSELARAWREHRDEVLDGAERLTAALRQVGEGRRFVASGSLSPAAIDAALEDLLEAYDPHHGGFGHAPKFPPHGALRLLLRALAPGGTHEPEIREALEIAARGTLDAMALGGIRDHVGGGFHRYATDAVWLVPHFEKMLYDNAQLLAAYAEAAALWGDDEYRRVAEETAAWVLRDMTGPEGAFHSALDADSEGEEGKYYLWSMEEVREALGPEEGALFARVYGFSERGNFIDPITGEEPGNIPHLKARLGAIAAEEGAEPEAFAARLEAARATLLERRRKRVPPGLDDKVLTSWNGLMVGALARAGRLLGRRDWVDAAERAVRFLLGTMRREGRLLRSYRAGAAGLDGYLEDHAYLVAALLDLHEVAADPSWLREAVALADGMIERFWDPADGGFFFVAADHESLIARTKDLFDEAIPSGNGMAAQALARLAAATGERRFADRLRELLRVYAGVLEQAPRAAESLLLGYALALDAGVLGGEGAAAASGAAASGVAPAEVAPAAGPLARVQRGPVIASVTAPRQTLARGESLDLTLTLDMEPGWHIQSARPSRPDLVATSVDLGLAEGLTPGEMRLPEGSVQPLGGERLSVYTGRATVRFTLTAAKDAPTGVAPVVLRVRHQACDERRCLAPESAELSFVLEVTA